MDKYFDKRLKEIQGDIRQKCYDAVSSPTIKAIDNVGYGIVQIASPK